MTTKQQERDALAKIRKIVEALGENSYIGTAFNGVFNIAEQNIEFDAAFSLAETAEIAREDAVKAKTEASELKAHHDKVCEANREYRDTIASLNETIVSLTAKNEDYYATWRKHENRAIKAEDEVIALKAKLYDLITAEA